MKSLRSIWIISLLVKIFLALLIPITNDEAYYWVWSQRLQLSYLDHPPFVAWLFKLSDWLPHIGVYVRIPAVILGHLTLLVWFLIWKQFFPLEIGKYKSWMWLALCTPLIGFGSLIVTPDLPLVFFWSLAIFFCFRILDRQNIFDYLAFGVTLGLGFSAKYHMVLLPVIFLVFLSVEKKMAQDPISMDPSNYPRSSCRMSSGVTVEFPK